MKPSNSKSCIFTFVFFLLSTIAAGQNLLTNSSFEANTGLPGTPGQLNLVSDWDDLVVNCDYMNTGYPGWTPNIGLAYTGNGYVGFATYGESDNSEAIGQQLAGDILQADTVYTVRFFAKKTSGVGFFGDYTNTCVGLQLYGFIDTPPNENLSIHLSDLPNSQLLFETETVVNETWQEYLGYFTPSVDMSYIGLTFAMTNCLQYVFIDDFVIEKANFFSLEEAIDICEGETLVLNVASQEALSYEWQDGTTTPFYTTNEAGLYTVTINYPDSIVTYTTTVGVQPIFNVELGNDTLLCENLPLSLEVDIENANYLWQDETTESTQLITESGNYSVTVTQGVCTVEDEIEITYFTDVDLDLGEVITICEGESVLLESGLSNLLPTWQDGTQSNTYLVTDGGDYSATIEQDGCVLADTVTVVLEETPTIDFNQGSPFLALCPEDTLLLDVSQAGATYEWQDGSTESTFLVTPDLVGFTPIGVFVTIGNCTATSGLFVDYVTLPTLDFPTDTVLCEGGSITLSVPNTNANVTWQDGTIGQTYQVTGSGEYYVEISQNNCSTSDTITVSTSIVPDIDPVFNNDTLVLCQADSLLIDVSQQELTYLWQDESSEPFFLITPAANGSEITLNVSNANCSTEGSFLVNYEEIPSLTPSEDITLCEGESLMLEVVNAQTDEYSYTWQDGSTLSFFEVNTAGLYSVTVETENCAESDSILVDLTSLPPDFLPADTTICIGDSLTINISDNQYTFFWEDGFASASRTITEAGEYSLTTSTENCEKTETLNVALQEFDCFKCFMFTPNAFSPNFDENNDTWKVNSNCDFLDYELRIYDRWGNFLFFSDNPSETWDGTFEDQPMPTGVYVATLNFQYLTTQTSEARVQDILLVR